MKIIYPVTITTDRYNGAYSGGRWLAWNLYETELPESPYDQDIPCREFWSTFVGVVGIGNTPNDAYEDLKNKLQEKSL